MRVPAPVPWLVDQAVGIISRETQAKTERASMAIEPGECLGFSERFFERQFAGGADVDGATGVMLAVSGRGHGLEDHLDFLTESEFAADDFYLAFDAAKTRQ